MSDFTPGPWRIANIHAQGMFLNNGSMVVTSDTDRICEVDCQAEFKRGAGHTAQCATRDANARLIAAAPELLSALQALMASIDMMDPEQWHVSTVAYADGCHAIAKALARAEEA